VKLHVLTRLPFCLMKITVTFLILSKIGQHIIDLVGSVIFLKLRCPSEPHGKVSVVASIHC